MGEDPREIREEIEATRERMSHTADALTYKADVRARAKERATAKRDALVGRVRGNVPANRTQAGEQITATKELLVGKVRGVAKNPGQTREQAVDTAKRAAAAIQGNPQLAAGAGALGVLIGLGTIRRARRSAPPPVNARTVNARAQRAAVRQHHPWASGERPAGYRRGPRACVTPSFHGVERRRLGYFRIARPNKPDHIDMTKVWTPRKERSRRRPMDTVAIGKAGLRGWRAKVADAVAQPVSKKTPLNDDQIRAVVGVAFFALSLVYVTGTLKRLAARN